MIKFFNAVNCVDKCYLYNHMLMCYYLINGWIVKYANSLKIEENKRKPAKLETCKHCSGPSSDLVDLLSIELAW